MTQCIGKNKDLENDFRNLKVICDGLERNKEELLLRL